MSAIKYDEHLVHMNIISRLFDVIRLIHSRHRFLVDMSGANDPNATPDKETMKRIMTTRHLTLV